jgi:hypothetical protein
VSQVFILTDGGEAVVTTDMVYDRPMNLSTWVTSDGRAYAVQKRIASDCANGSQTFKGYCFHVPLSRDESAVKVTINARFSMIAVACAKYVSHTVLRYTG